MVHVRSVFFLVVALLTACKDGKPELTSLMSPSTAARSTPAASEFGNGRITSGSYEIMVPTSNYKVRGRVMASPQALDGATTNYKIKAYVEL